MENAVSVVATWRDLGFLRLDDASKLAFPAAPAEPGLYCFELVCNGAKYVGETDNLRRRLQHYRAPGPSQFTNIRLNGLLAEQLVSQSAEVAVRVCDEAKLLIDQSWRRADLTKKLERVLVEHAVLVDFISRGCRVLNARA